jgi:DNA-binding NtrC family response regulator
MIGGKKILFVEDEVIINEMLNRYFSLREELKGAKIFFAKNVQQCLELLENEKPTLMFLDLDLDDSSPPSGFKILKDYKDKLKIVIVTGYGECKEQCLNSGAFMFLTKPIKREDYIKIIPDHL